MGRLRRASERIEQIVREEIDNPRREQEEDYSRQARERTEEQRRAAERGKR